MIAMTIAVCEQSGVQALGCVASTGLGDIPFVEHVTVAGEMKRPTSFPLRRVVAHHSGAGALASRQVAVGGD